MTLVLTRVDDRLIHGQVVVGWGRALSPDRIVLVDDRIAGEEWEHDLYRAGVPSALSVDFLTIAEAAGRIPDWTASAERVLLLVADVDSVARLCEGAPAITAVNLGGFHRGDGRKQRLPYLFLSDEELSSLRGLEQRGVQVTAQDLPNTPPVPLEKLCR